MTTHRFAPRPTRARRPWDRTSLDVLLVLVLTLALSPAQSVAQPSPGGGGDVTNPDDPTPALEVLYNGLWRPSVDVHIEYAENQPAFDAIHASHAAAGRQLFDFEHSQSRWTGLWRQYTGPAVDADKLIMHIDAAQLQIEQNNQRAMGYELVDLELRVVDQVLRVHGVFHPDAPEHIADLGIPIGDIPALVTSMGLENYSLVDIEPYIDPTGVRLWALLWSQESLGTTFEIAKPGQTDANLLANANWRPIDLEAYLDESLAPHDRNVAGIWMPSTDPTWFLERAEWDADPPDIGILDRDATFAGDPSSLSWKPPQNLIDLDIEPAPDIGVKPMTSDHDGPVNPAGG